jgi:hypothetical protein
MGSAFEIDHRNLCESLESKLATRKWIGSSIGMESYMSEARSRQVGRALAGPIDRREKCWAWWESERKEFWSFEPADDFSIGNGKLPVWH